MQSAHDRRTAQRRAEATQAIARHYAEVDSLVSTRHTTDAAFINQWTARYNAARQGATQ